MRYTNEMVREELKGKDFATMTYYDSFAKDGQSWGSFWKEVFSSSEEEQIFLDWLRA